MYNEHPNNLLLQNKVESLKWEQDWGVFLFLIPFLFGMGFVNFYFIMEKIQPDTIGIFNEYASELSLYKIVIPLSLSLWFVCFASLLLYNLLSRRIKAWKYQKEFFNNPETWCHGIELDNTLETVPADFGEVILIPLGYVTLAFAIPISLCLSYEKNFLLFFLSILLLIILFIKIKCCYYIWLCSHPNVEIDYHPLPKNKNSRILVYSKCNNLEELVSVTLVCEETRTNTRSKHAAVEFKDIYREILFNAAENSEKRLVRLLIEFSVPSNMPITQKTYDMRIREEISVKWKIEIDQNINQNFIKKLEYDLVVV
ncbi:hypothetical protein FACS189454_06020 [Planctomycetales bacterium]|nr:hypothetical protein FACS189454_06020 [Planctomycetales bacterium]